MTDREIDTLVAEKVMGWKPGQLGNWRFSSSIQDAWQVVERMTSNGTSEFPKTCTFELMQDEDGDWWAGFKLDGWLEGDRPHPMVGMDGHSAARAICLAALKAVGVEVKS